MKLPSFIDPLYRESGMQSFFKQVQAMSKAVTVTNDYSGSSNPHENFTDAQNLAQYKQSLYLYIGVSMISQRVASLPFSLYQVTNTKGDFKELFDHEIISLMNQPNQDETRREFWLLSVIFYLLAGDCFWYLERNKGGGKIIQKHALRPDYVDIVRSSEGTKTLAYEYRNGDGTILSIKPESILHFKNPDPTNPLRGVGVVRPASSRILTEREASRYQTAFFKNQGRPDVAVFADRDVNDEEAEEARRKWLKTYGSGQGGMAGFFGKDIKSIKELTAKPNEMGYTESMKFLRDDILAALRIPKAMITSDDVNLANAKTAKIVFLENAVVPVADTFRDIINNKFLPAIDPRLFVAYENPVPEDRDLLLKEATAGYGKWLTTNEIRDDFGREAIDGHDDIAAQPSTITLTPGDEKENKRIAKEALASRPILYKLLDAAEKLANVTVMAQKSAARTKGVRREMNSLFPTKEQKVSWAKAVNEDVDNRSESVKSAIDGYHNRLAKRIAHQNKDGFVAGNFIDESEEISIAKGEMRPVISKLYAQVGQDVLDALVTDKSVGEEFTFTDDAVEQIDKRVEFFAKSMVGTTLKQIDDVIKEGLKDGAGPDEISKKIRDKMGDISKGRANTIARTETGNALSAATNDAYGQSSIVTGKEWITAGDGNVRDEHVMNAGVIVDKGGVFPNGEAYPGDQTINCRCVLAPAV